MTESAEGRPQSVTIHKLLRAAYGAFAASALFSFAVNLLMLTLPLFMFQVFDRVMASRSETTLIFLLLMASSRLPCRPRWTPHAPTLLSASVNGLSGASG